MTAHLTLVRPPARQRTKRPADLHRAQATKDGFRRASLTVDPLAKARILDEVVLLNLPIADRLAMRYARRGIPTQDLVQVARVGLVQATRRFDADAGFDFFSFAVPTILGELKRHFRDRGWTVRPSRNIQELRPKIQAATSDLTQALERTPTRSEVAEELGVDEATIAEAQIAAGCFTATSLDQPVATGSQTTATWVDTLGREDATLEWVELFVTLGPLFRSLSDRDRLVLRMRLVDDMTQQEIGGIVGVTQMQVSRILARIMRLTKDELAG